MGILLIIKFEIVELSQNAEFRFRFRTTRLSLLKADILSPFDSPFRATGLILYPLKISENL